jgi:hypothetical protein
VTIEKTVIALYMQGENEISENIFATTEFSQRKKGEKSRKFDLSHLFSLLGYPIYRQGAMDLP